MRRVIAATLAAAAAMSAPAFGRARSCVGPRARVLARDTSLAVYETRPRSAGEPRATWACLAGHKGHMTLLAPTRLNAHISLGRFQLAGRVVAYLATQFGVDSGSTDLVVVDVGARRVLHSIAVGSYVDAGIISSEAVARFLVTAQGSVAWTATREEHRTPAGASVHAASRDGAPVLLDSGPAIDPDSLALSRTTLSWTDAGTVRTAPMP